MKVTILNLSCCSLTLHRGFTYMDEKKGQPFTYMLRYALTPDHLESERMEALIAFCERAAIDDVMFFIAPMELHHITTVEAKPWLDTISRAMSELEKVGVTTSINPLTTLGHDDATNRLLAGQSFQTMVDPYGREAAVTACPLCPEWRKHIIDVYVHYAAAKPITLWVEDDFRFHNHSPLEWGGCFCEAHMELFAREAGVARLERSEFVRGVLASGTPHPYRRIWLDTCRRTLVELAREIAAAVHDVSPSTRIGLMSSSPIIHAAEGRDWHGIVHALSGDTAQASTEAVVRVHLPAYGEMSGIQYGWDFAAVSRLTAALLPDHTEIYPELENVPYSAFSKSAAFQRYQMETALLLGSRGITLNIIDMAGNGLYPQEKYEQWLAAEKAFLQAVGAMKLHECEEIGVQILVNERSSYTLHTAEQQQGQDQQQDQQRGQLQEQQLDQQQGLLQDQQQGLLQDQQQGQLHDASSSLLDMEKLYPQETMWAGLLSAFGIANRYITNTDEAREGQPLALSGQVLRNYDEAAIKRLFESASLVLLDGEAIYTLHRMGLGALCGISGAQWHTTQSYEQIVNNVQYAGMKEVKMRPFLAMGRVLEIEYLPNQAVEISQIRSMQGASFSGMTMVRDKFFLLPYDEDGHRAMMHPVRRAVLQEVLHKQAGEQPLTVASYAPLISVHEYRAGDRQVIAIVNHAMDTVHGIELSGQDLSGSWRKLSRSEPDGKTLTLRTTEGRTAVHGTFPPMTMVILAR